MPVIKMKPTSPGTRFRVKLDKSHLWKGGPFEPLTEKQNKHSGRNNVGRITTRHQGAGAKQKYRLIDFRRDKDGIKGVVERIEHDPNRSGHIALVCYKDGERRYIIAPKGVNAGDTVQSGSDAPIKPGNALPLRNIPAGTNIHCVEMRPGKGAQLARSAGAAVQLVAREGDYVTVRLRSGEIRKVHADCRATIGEVSNEENNLRHFGKAGAMRWRGIRPTVRGLAMNPVDHPHGGGEGKSGQGNPHPVSPWGQKAKGLHTRKNKRTERFIVSSRHREKRT